jgi:hypothetical protein
MLGGWGWPWSALGWAVLGSVPPAIIALYFLKLKRLPLEVPSTYLWRKSIEDMHVNSLWQRLRKSLLLLLQLLLVALAMLALTRPSWSGAQLSGGRYIFLVDNSASMRASDVQPTRLDEAKRRVGELIDQMNSGDVAMLISFADSARVEQMFTDNRRELRRKLAAIEPTNRTTSLAEALKVASGLANPGRSATEYSDTQVAEAMPATLYIMSDGKFADVQGFSLGNLEPVYVPIGQQEAAASANVGIVAFSTRRQEETAGKLQAFARLENYGPAKAAVRVDLYLDDKLIDAEQVTMAPGEAGAAAFDLGDIPSGVLRLEAKTNDALKVDDTTWAAVNPPRRAKVLVVTPGNTALRFALGTPRAAELAEVTFETPEYLTTSDYRTQSAAGKYRLVVYDRCRPEAMPRANTLWIGRLPPVGGWASGAKVTVPQIIDTDRSHPLMQLVEMGDVLILEGLPLKPPAGASNLIESHDGVLFAIAPREGFEDAVLGFELVRQNALGTNWPVRFSFPVFVLNTLRYLGGGQEALAAGSVRPGQTVSLLSTKPVDRLSIHTPADRVVEVPRGKLNTFSFSGTDDLGVYAVWEGRESSQQRFAVNLFDSAESDIKPRPENSIRIGYVEVKGKTHWEVARRESWKILLLAALVVLLFEWYIYNRRVYL